jgi:RNA polymerase sigma factor (sigma-70 family)
MADRPDRFDSELLAAYLSTHSDDAIAQLVHRHGRMVFGVCRRILGNHTDAEDAFQATFLVLVQRARLIRKGQSVGPWLHRVALRTAMRARSIRSTMNTRHKSMTEDDLVDGKCRTDPAFAEIVDEALNALSERDRAVIVLCDLEGRKHREAAAELNVPVSTVSNRLSRAREKLRRELKRRGIVVSLSALAGALSQMALPSPASAAIAQSTLEVVRHASMLGLAAKGPVPANAVGLAKAVLIGLTVAKGAAALIVGAVLGVGSASLSPRSDNSRGPKDRSDNSRLVVLAEGNRAIGPLQASESLGVGSIVLPPQGRLPSFVRQQVHVLQDRQAF